MEQKYYEQPPTPSSSQASAPEKRVYAPLQRLMLLFALTLGGIAAFWWFGEAGAFFSGTVRAFVPAYAVFWAVYAAGFCAANPKRALRPSSLFLLAATALLFLRYAIYAQAETSLLNLFVIPLLLMLHAVDCSFDVPACREGQYFSLYLRGWFVAPFACIGRFFGALSSLFPRGKGSPRARAVRLGLLCALPVAILVASLLLQADAVMAYYLTNFLKGLSFGSFLPRLAGALLVAMLFYSFLYAMTWQKPAVPDAPYQKAIDPASVLAALGLLLAVYAVFAAFQFTYLTGLAGLPAELTYSEYAVRGFRELCAVAAINFAAFGVCLAFTREHRALRPMLLALLGATALILVSALFRLALYIRAYGLTINRILPLWFMLFLLAVLALCAAKLYRPKLRLIRLLAGVLVAWYLCLSALNLDAIIAKSVLADAERKGGLTETNANLLRYQLSQDARGVLLKSPLREQIYYDVAPEDIPSK